MAPDNLDDYIARQGRETRTTAGGAVLAVVDQNPDTAAYEAQLAKRYNLPADVVRFRRDDFQRQAKLEDASAELDRSPGLAAYIAANPNAAALAHDDLGPLGLVESSMNLLRGARERFDKSKGGFGRYLATLHDPVREAERIDVTNPQFAFEARNHGKTPEQYKQEQIERARQSMTSIRGYESANFGYKEQTSWEDVKRDPVRNAPLRVIEQGVVSLPSMLFAGAAPGAFTTSLTGEMAQNRAANDGRTDADTGDVALSLPSAALQTALERLGLEHMLPGGGQVAGSILKEVGKAAVVEGATEAAQTTLQSITETAGTERGFDLGQTLDQAADAAVTGAGLGGSIRTVTSAAETATLRGAQRQAKAAEAVEGAQAIDTFVEAVGTSKLQQRSPDDFRKYVAAIAETGAVSDIYVDAKTFAQAMRTTEGQKALEAMPAVADQLDLAAAADQDVRIPVEDFATHVAALPNYAEIAEHLKTEPDGLTRAEAQTMVDRQVEDLREDFESALSEAQKTTSTAEAIQRIASQVAAQLDATGRFRPNINKLYADFVARNHASDAARLGRTVDEQAASYPLRITSGDSQIIGGALEQGVITGYHAAEVPIDTFKPMSYGDAGDHSYFYFAKSEKWARNFHKETRHGSVPVMHKAQLDIKNPLDLRGKTMTGPEWADYFTSIGAAPDGAYAEKLQAAGRRRIAAWEILRLDTPQTGAMREKLIGLGYDGLVLTDTTRGKADPTAYVAFSPDQIKIQKQFEQTGADTARGTFNPETLEIALHKNADFSTFLHELGHFRLHVLMDMARQPDAPAGVVDDARTTMREYGGDASEAAIDNWHNMSLDEQRETHERFARAFELYLFENKAPTSSLHTLFRRFSAWLVSIYKNVQNLDVELSDDVRGVMDRLVASHEIIAEAEAAQAYTNPVTEKPDGTTQEEWQAYNDLAAEASMDAEAYLASRSLRDMKYLDGARSRELRRLQREAADARKRIRAEVTAEVMAEPINRARRFLTHGEIDGAPVEGAHKLDLSTVKELFPAMPPAEITAALGTGQYGMVMEGGEHPDIIADRFGYSSGQGLIHHLILDERAVDKIKGLTNQRMLEEHGELIDEASLKQAVAEALRNQARIRFTATQAAMFDKGVGNSRTLQLAAQALAKQVIGRQNLRDVRPDLYAAAEARAGRAAVEAFRKGDMQAYAEHKRKQLFNMQLAKAATNERAALAKAEKFFNDILSRSDESLARSRNMDLVNVVRYVLAPYGFLAAKNDPAAYLARFKEYDPEAYADIEPWVAAALASAPSTGDVRDITVDEFTALHDTVAQIYKLSYDSAHVTIAGEKVLIQHAVDALSADLDAHTPRAQDGPTRNPSEAEKFGRRVRSGSRYLVRFENWCDVMGAAFTRNLWNPISDGANRYRVERNARVRQLAEQLSQAAPSITRSQIDAPEISHVFNGKRELLHALAHTGNESNKRKLLLGGQGGAPWAVERSDGSLDTSQWDALIARYIAEGQLTKADFDLVQRMWDEFEAIKPAAQRTHRALRGRYFDEIEATPLVTPFGEYRGGYVPAIADTHLVPDAALRELARNDNESGRGMLPSVARGFTKSRVDDYTAPLLLDLATLPGHMDKVLKFTHLAIPARDVSRLTRNQTFARKLHRIDDTAITGLIEPFLERAVRQTTDGGPTDDGGRAFGEWATYLRQGASLQMIAGNLNNAVQQSVSFIGAFVRLDIGKGYVWRALAHHRLSPGDMLEAAREASPFMRQRIDSQAYEMQTVMTNLLRGDKVTVYTTARDWVLAHAHFLQRGVANVCEPVIWHATYAQALDQGKSHDDAVRDADANVRMSQGDTAPESVAKYEDTHPIFKLMTMFSSYFNAKANLVVGESAKTVRQIRTGEISLKRGAWRLAYIQLIGWMIEGAVTAIIGRALMAGIDDENEDGQIWDDVLGIAFEGTFKYAAAALPGVGSAIQFAYDKYVGHKTTPLGSNISVSPVVSLVQASISLPENYARIINGDGNKRRAVRDTLNLIGLVTKLPLGALGRPLGYGAGVAADEIEPTDPVDLLRGLATGAPSTESKQ